MLQEKDRLKKEKDEAEAKYKHALVDGRKEQVRAQQAAWRNPCKTVMLSHQVSTGQRLHLATARAVS